MIYVSFITLFLVPSDAKRVSIRSAYYTPYQLNKVSAQLDNVSIAVQDGKEYGRRFGA